MSMIDAGLRLSQLPANRRWEPSLSETCRVGIDTIRVGGSATPDQLLNMPESRFVRRVDQGTGELSDTPYKGHVPLGIGDLHLNVERRRSGWSYWYVETSVPRLLRGNNLSPASPDDLLQALHQIEPLVVEQLGSVDPPEDWHMSRLDITRDFHAVSGRALLLDGLAVLPAQHAKVNQQYRSPARGDTLSLRKGTPGRYMSSVYDKYEETYYQGSGVGGLGTPGHVRFEVSLRRPVLRDAGLLAVADVTATATEALARTYFRRCGYDRKVRGMNRAMMEINLHLDDLDRSERKQVVKMVGILHMQAAGLDPRACAGTLKVHLDLARKLGLSAADFVNPGDHALRLDFDTGTQVVDRT